VRNYISPAESSVSTWVGYDTPVAFGISYYTQGQNLGALLDLSILNDTNGQKGLDDVMRALFNEQYKRGRGFTTEEMIAIINRITKRDYHDFYRKYVFGTDVPNYDQIFGYAGYRKEEKEQQAPVLGFNARFRGTGIALTGVQPNSPASAAGLQIGDLITKIDGQPISAVNIGSLAGKAVKLSVTRRGEDIEVPMTVGSRAVKSWQLVSVATPTIDQLRVRKSWLVN
jgi:predicted metalloprotease with PDZ domain